MGVQNEEDGGNGGVFGDPMTEWVCCSVAVVMSQNFSLRFSKPNFRSYPKNLIKGFHDPFSMKGLREGFFSFFLQVETLAETLLI